jgi:hypothetical protein
LVVALLAVVVARLVGHVDLCCLGRQQAWVNYIRILHTVHAAVLVVRRSTCRARLVSSTRNQRRLGYHCATVCVSGWLVHVAVSVGSPVHQVQPVCWSTIDDVGFRNSFGAQKMTSK